VVEQPKSIVRNCTCTASDFEWYVESRPEQVPLAHTISEFNYYRDKSGRCVLVEGAAALTLDTSEEQCDGYTTSWYERTAYRKIPYSSCEGGERPDRGKQHACPGLIGGGGLGGLFWGSVAILPFACAGVAGWWWFTKGGRPGWVGLVIPWRVLNLPRAIRLGDHRAFGGDNGSGFLHTIASVPYFLVGVSQAGWAWVTRKVPFLDGLFTRSEPYRQVPIDDDGKWTNEGVQRCSCWPISR
jgi:hypothetical protein